jgi:hypothetical protein
VLAKEMQAMPPLKYITTLGLVVVGKSEAGVDATWPHNDP